MTSGLEDMLVTVFGEWLSDPEREVVQRGLIALHNYPHITGAADIRHVALDWWEDYLNKSSEILSDNFYLTAEKQAKYCVVCAAALGAVMNGLVGAGVGCIVGGLVPCAIAGIHGYMIRARTNWLYVSLQLQNPDDWEGAIKYALDVHKDKLDKLAKGR